MPIRFMPLVREVITNAPMSEPSTLPTPPAADTPPTKAAAMASNSNNVPALVVADCRREAYRIPDSAASIPIEAKTICVIPLTLIPLNSAASGFPPTA